MKKLYFLLIFLSVFIAQAGTPSIIFKENKGQWPNKVLFGTEFLNTKFYVNRTGFNYCVYSAEDLLKSKGNHRSSNDLLRPFGTPPPKEEEIIHGHNFIVNFLGADFSSAKKNEVQKEYFNYFLGNDKSKWASEVKAYKNVSFNEIYKGVGLNLYSDGLNLKYDLIVKPNTNIDIIKLNYEDVDGIMIKNNEVVVKTSVGEIIEKSPVAYQIINGKRVEVKCNYVLLDENTIGFSLPNSYNKNYELIIDPVVVVCSYSGSTIDCDNYACTGDAKGNIYDAGISSPGYPTTTGAFQMVCKDAYRDIVISKYDSLGTARSFSTYLGGDSLEFPLEILVKNNEITIMGITLSKDYPITIGAFDTLQRGNYDLVFSKLNMNGTSLLASTYMGGNGNEGFNTFATGWDNMTGEFVCDTAGNVYAITGTNSANFPTTVGALSSIKKGTIDAAVFKLDKTFKKLLFSTFLGGALSESGRSIRLDGTGGVYCFGSTNSPNFPTKPGCISSTRNGVIDFYVSHINSTGSALIASTFLGTATDDYAVLMDIDQNNDIYLCGNFSNPSLLIPTPGAYGNVNGYNCIYKVNSSLSNVIYKTKFGNLVAMTPQYLNFTAFNVDSCQNIYVSGFGANSFPTTPNEFQTYGGGNTDMWIALFNPNCSSLAFASFFGGPMNTVSVSEHVDAGSLSRFDDRGYLYQAICTAGGLPTTPGALAPNFVNTTTMTTIFNDAFLKVDFRTFVNAGSAYGPNLTACPPFTANLFSNTNTGTAIWDFGDGSPFDTIANTTHQYNNYGIYNIVLMVTDTNTCNRTDSVKTKLSVIPPTAFDLGPDKSICLNSTLLIKSNVSAVTYTWSTGETTPNITVHYPGLYQLTINNGGCESSDVVNVKINEEAFEVLFPNVITPNNDGVNEKIDFTKYHLSDMEFFVYDRWGKERFKTTDVNAYWDTRDYDEGTYFYVINYKSTCTGKTKTNKGFISVFK